MPSTLQNIPLIRNQWVNLYSASGIAVGTQIVIENLTDTPVKLYAGATPPPDADENDGYFRRLMEYAVKSNDVDDVGAWALCEGEGAFVSVKEKIYSYLAKDYFTEVRAGNVPGHSLIGKVVEDTNTSTTFKDIWPESGNMTFRTDGVAEIWEVVSSSDEDKPGGAGATDIDGFYLDPSYIPKSASVELNGTTPVQFAVDCYRPNAMVVTKVEPGGTLQNVGVITLRVAGGGAVRNIMPALNGVTTDGHLTVPANHTIFILQVITLLPKNVDGRIQTLVKGPLPTDPWRSAGDLPYYQNTSTFEVLARIPVQEKTDLVYRALTSSEGVKINRVAELLMIENDYIATSQFFASECSY